MKPIDKDKEPKINLADMHEDGVRRQPKHKAIKEDRDHGVERAKTRANNDKS